jgi:hypothetical protein
MKVAKKLQKNLLKHLVGIKKGFIFALAFEKEANR